MSKNLLDASVMGLLSLTPFYKDGWGDPRIVLEARRRFLDIEPTKDISVKWVDRKSKREGDLWFDEGYFESPVDLPVPAITRTAWFLRIVPDTDSDRPVPMVVLLSATGDETYIYRKLFAKPLLEAGIGVILLVNPFYGKRRPPGQWRSSIRSFSDQLLMNYMTIEESRSLLKWLKREHDVVGVSGYSMGGFMAAYTCAMYEDPIACVPAAAGLSAGETFTKSVMKQVPAWDKLKLKDVELEPQELFTRSLAPLNLDELDRPKDPDSAIMIGCKNDAVILPDQVEALYNYWKPRELRWLDAGHSTGYMLHMRDIAQAVIDAVAIRTYKHSKFGD